ncbi:hypothetical protein [Plantactinospora sonchi]|uniref:Uncharacterized protein n=1 Tax=Plantactinospora sonchi TaxID=1544735 RepID=A0ABU7RLH8_9ACTN
MTSTLTPMDPRRRDALRALLVEQAGTSRRQPVAPHEPRPQPWRRPVVRRAAFGTAAAAAVAVTVAVMVTADPAAPPSYASWTAVPATAPGGTASDEDIETWASACSDLKVGAVGIEGVGARRSDAAGRTALVDRRGDITYCVDIALGSGTSADPFIALSGIRADGLSRMWVNTTDEAVQPPAAGEVIVAGGDELPLSEGETGSHSLQAYQLYGMAGPDVTGVTIVLGNELRITATVQGGIWGAWWPAERGEPTASRVDIDTATGTRTLPTESLRMG